MSSQIFIHFLYLSLGDKETVKLKLKTWHNKEESHTYTTTGSRNLNSQNNSHKIQHKLFWTFRKEVKLTIYSSELPKNSPQAAYLRPPSLFVLILIQHIKDLLNYLNSYSTFCIRMINKSTL